jgi:hypothetical protein
MDNRGISTKSMDVVSLVRGLVPRLMVMVMVTKAAVKSNATTGYVGAVRPYRPCKIRHGAQPP